MKTVGIPKPNTVFATSSFAAMAPSSLTVEGSKSLLFFPPPLYHHHFPLLLFLLLLLVRPCCPAASPNDSFVFNNFRTSNLILSESSIITKKGALRLTNGSTHLPNWGYVGHAFYPAALQFKTTPAGRTQSFSTRFVFAIVSKAPQSGGHGLAFAMAPSTNLSNAKGSQYLGLVDVSPIGNSSNHIFAVEFDTVRQPLLQDIDDNHVGIDINSVISNASSTASYYTDDGKNETVLLDSRTLIQAWIDYDGHMNLLNVTIAPLSSHPQKPKRPLISYSVDLSPVLHQYMYAGFSAGTQRRASEHYVLAWSFMINGQAPELDLSQLPPIPKASTSIWKSRFLPYASILFFLLVCVVAGISWAVYRRRKLTHEKIEEWELEYPHRLPYKEVYRATEGFNKKKLLGKGGFGSVYKGVLPRNGVEVAVKRVSHGAEQGMKEFVAEVSTLGRLRHKNLVQLQGWCRRGEELLLVYDLMPNGSLDSYLFGDKRCLSWGERFNILKGIASSLLYLHDEWEQIVVHRDVKASNVLLDAAMNGKLGDFGLARLYDYGANPKTTRIVGTIGYLAPELSSTYKATTSSDVFSYGALLLEVACGRRPVGTGRASEEVLLVNLVHSLWKEGRILSAVDKRLGMDYVEEEAELVLKLGVHCSQATPAARPSMRHVVKFLNGDSSLEALELQNLVMEDDQVFDQLVLQFSSSSIRPSNRGSCYATPTRESLINKNDRVDQSGEVFEVPR
ncbi:L-type lectin-domain containing receptor kinase SIT2-like [Nymphaea colorata]|uniref:L-type lectin-domain containing receptor kinase SIT2-like n=1 Tax=Nymphaea colorata TaxID=210225 RepID=UPI00129E01F6|nr:L-type lectin-domain containing receptor kinase SIT2-like [Nymphaea colorata]